MKNENSKYDKTYKSKNEYKLIKTEYNEEFNCSKCCFYPHSRNESFCRFINITKSKTAYDICTRNNYFIEV